MVKLPHHTDKSMSHVAVSHFNMEKGSVDTGEEDSRVVGPKLIRKKSSIDDNSGRNQGKVFNTKYPRINWSVEKYNPLPQKPYMVELLAPERYPTDKLVQAIRVYRKEVEEIGGDTKMLHDYEDAHLKRNHSPEASDLGDLEAADKPVLLEVEKGVPMAIHARSTPYWAGHAPVCDDPASCKHFLLLHPGFGFFGK
uniref:Vascular cell adhesion protein 1 n=1 Tax=Lygus hesperus TaxID=30085 RepID=A0A0A9WU26_LYGHE